MSGQLFAQKFDNNLNLFSENELDFQIFNFIKSIKTENSKSVQRSESEMIDYHDVMES